MDITVPGTVSVELVAGAHWTITLSSNTLWTRAIAIDPSVTREITLDVRPAGVVRGTVRGPSANEIPSDLSVLFAPASDVFPVGADSSRCDLAEQGKFACVVPLGEQHLRFKTSRFPPVYRWRANVQATTTIGEIRFAKGGTVAGSLSSADLPAKPQDLRIVIAPSPRNNAAGATASTKSIEVVQGPHGFFSSVPVAPGLYDVFVEVPHRGVAIVAAIPVRDGFEARLPRALTLEPRLPLVLKLEPPRPPQGSTWQVEIERLSDEGRQPVTRGNVAEDGSFRVDNVVAGRYAVVVLDDRGARWTVRNFTVSTGASEINIDIPVVFVEGTVRRGEEPIAARLLFGGEFGIPSIPFESDADGAFRGLLPRTGEWLVDVFLPPSNAPLAVRTNVEPATEDEPAHADVRIANTRIEGSVVDDEGQAVAHAEVTFNRGPERLGSVTTDAEGEFAVSGLLSGDATAIATAAGKRSALVSLRIHEDANAPLRLVVRELSALKSRVMGPAGPVAGARVAIWPEAGGQVSLSITDGDGFFTAMGQPPGPRLLLAVHAPGLALHLGAIDSTPPQQIMLTTLSGTIDVESKSRPMFLDHGGMRLPLQLALKLLAPAATSDAEGRRLHLGDLPPGDYRVCAPNGAGEPLCASGWLAAGASLQLNLAPP
ncbi:MAG TPA: carboxypeptidase-like regulatory domain-containing protein [Thermoanaerobaculia bacterium]|nr:carboxypeptidase-like regulatory domain-containing protein [Thermoanaerobaculia bacterium]